ncbi:serine kinase [Actibacterium mucosum KCTC 23349]|uniref:Serine kinase n=1 Tax=Actibacterium mucosum KCTC 23349 TaxID=1454373 RepID=A0A037ZN15_9RHOB|nr:serine kinase [Actibacterium mucosum KCTC 23349]
MAEADHPDILHASCVHVDGAGVLITGPSGAGKSALALGLMALGARLVADDRTILTVHDGQLIADCPPPLRGLIEARGVGILNAPASEPVPVRLVVDLAQTETERLPPNRDTSILGCNLNLLHGSAHAHFPAAILQYLKGGRYA